MTKREKRLNAIIGAGLIVFFIGVPIYLYFFFHTQASNAQSTPTEKVDTQENSFNINAFGEGNQAPLAEVNFSSEAIDRFMAQYFSDDENFVPESILPNDLLLKIKKAAMQDSGPLLQNDPSTGEALSYPAKDLNVLIEGYRASVRVFFDKTVIIGIELSGFTRSKMDFRTKNLDW